MQQSRCWWLAAYIVVILALAASDWWAAGSWIVAYRGAFILFLCVVGYAHVRVSWTVERSSPAVDELRNKHQQTPPRS